MLDVLTLGLAAGLSFDASLELYCERYDGELSRALLESMLAWRMGIRSREAELARLADELGVPAFRRFASVVGESLSFGTPLAEALERQGEAIRSRRCALQSLGRFGARRWLLDDVVWRTECLDVVGHRTLRPCGETAGGCWETAADRGRPSTQFWSACWW